MNYFKIYHRIDSNEIAEGFFNLDTDKQVSFLNTIWSSQRQWNITAEETLEVQAKYVGQQLNQHGRAFVKALMEGIEEKI